MSAILFGSISTLADTSELQRAAFNEAFAAHGLDWQWDRAEYQDLLASSGGQDRIAEYAQQRGESVDAAAVHESKSKTYQTLLAGTAVKPRPGVVDTIHEARDNGWKVALVTTTSSANIDALLDALAPEITPADFDMVVDAASAATPKPDPAAYSLALRELGEQPQACIAIEDNLGGVEAAKSASVPCVAFANANTTGHDFGDTPRVAHLEFAELSALAPGH
jgi:HAD superfamily hydrolase (TIGR01509 family)